MAARKGPAGRDSPCLAEPSLTAEFLADYPVREWWKGLDQNDRKPHELDEPQGEGYAWVEWGVDRMWAAGFTEGGAPFGLTESEFRKAGRQGGTGPGWAVAAEVLRQVLVHLGAADEDAEVGWVRYLGDGLTYVTYGADCPLPDGKERPLVVRLPRPGAEDDQETEARREQHLLQYLQGVDQPFRLPRTLGVRPVEGGLAVVQEWLSGVPADLRASRFPGGCPWELVGRVAAWVHDLDPEPLRAVLSGYDTRREHALAFARVLERVSGSDGEAVRGWVREHLPPAEPSCLLHGDLLGQNLLLSWEDEPVGVVDWGAALLGDPAYDLAVVTRGVRRPFQVSGGLQRLLEEYHRAGGRPVSIADVYLHELCLRAKLFLDAAEDHGEGSAHAGHLRNGMMKVLERAERGEGG
jgi:aminoglycoside phosphotransferase (APT) family kinase protein